MKKLISLLMLGAISLSTLQSAEVPKVFEVLPAKPFNGSYLGLSLGFTQRVNTDELVRQMPDNGQIKHTKRSSGGQYGIYAGYGRVNPSNIYMGLEATLHSDSLNKAKHSHNLPLGDQNEQVKTRYFRGTVFGLAPRIGLLMSPSDLLYVKANLQFSRDWVSNQSDKFGKQKSFATNQVTLVPAIGYEKALNKNIMRLEYGYNLGAHINNNKKLTHSSKYHAHEVKLGYAYQF